MITTTMLWTTVLMLGLALLGWLGSELESKRHQRQFYHSADLVKSTRSNRSHNV